MADFKQAIAKVLKNEGGYVDNPNDLGGTTNFGISLRFLQSIDKTATKETIKNIMYIIGCHNLKSYRIRNILIFF